MLQIGRSILDCNSGRRDTHVYKYYCNVFITSRRHASTLSGRVASAADAERRRCLLWTAVLEPDWVVSSDVTPAVAAAAAAEGENHRRPWRQGTAMVGREKTPRVR